MALRRFLQRPGMKPGLALGVVLGFYIRREELFAEAPDSEDLPIRKPIYDDTITPSKPSKTQPPTESSTKSPTPTDRLANQVGRGRLFLQAHTSAAEGKLNSTMTRILNLENSFTSTIASLAPSPQTHERVMPGALYVLVSAMAGSIVVRNRNILLRATAPVALGLTAGWVLIPHTMRNVGDLVWQFEEKAPVIALNHLRVSGAAEEGYRQIRQRSKSLGEWADERVSNGREAVEGWVRKGR